MGLSNGIPFLDLVSPHVELEAEFTAVFHKVLRSAMFIGGPTVENFEREFASFCDARFAVGVSSGTDALRFALLAAGIRKGDSVLTVPNTFIATTEDQYLPWSPFTSTVRCATWMRSWILPKSTT